MQLKSIIEEVVGLRYIIDHLDLQSSVGRRVLLASEFITTKENVEHELSNIQHVVGKLCDKDNSAVIDRIRLKLSQIRDIKGTIRDLERNAILDDVQLFEVKHFAMYASEIREIAEKSISPIELPNLNSIISLLDPDGNRIPSFYIYDSYSSELAGIRKDIKKQKDDNIISDLLEKANAIEDVIREKLSKELSLHAEVLKTSLNNTAKLDIILAKAQQAVEFQFVKPTIVDETTSYQGIFNPLVKDVLESEGKHYQPVDISLDRGICLITGANMAGKTVLLKTIALCQYMLQFGFFIPATQASICLVNRVLTSIGDEQSELKGLSAFASEILKVNHIVTVAKTEKKLLVLIDELARTTNPTEGKAIVSATANLLNTKGIRGIITTHYSGVNVGCRRLRVKGFVDRIDANVTQSNLSSYIDYSLVDDDSGIVPQEALRIASLLGVDDELLSLAKKEIEHN